MAEVYSVLLYFQLAVIDIKDPPQGIQTALYIVYVFGSHQLKMRVKYKHIYRIGRNRFGNE